MVAVSWNKVRLLVAVILLPMILLVAVETAMHRYFIGDKPPPEVYGLMMLRISQKNRGWTIRPGTTGLLFSSTYSSYVRYNDKGLRGPTRSYRSKPGVYRILLVGDSFMEGYQVPLDKLFATRLEELLTDKSVEIINLSIGGYGTVQEYLYLREEGLKYQPDLVLLAFPPGSDIRDNSMKLQRLYARRFGGKAGMRPYVEIGDGRELRILIPDAGFVDVYAKWRRELIARSRARAFWKQLLVVRYVTAQFAREGEPKVNPNIRYGAYIGEYDPALYPIHRLTNEEYKMAWKRSWQATQKLILAIAALANQAGSQFALFTVPARIQVDDGYFDKTAKRYPSLIFDLDRIDNDVERFARDHQIRVLNLTPVFREHYAAHNEALFLGKEDQHWNRAGHRVAADAVAGFVDSCFLFPDPVSCRARDVD